MNDKGGGLQEEDTGSSSSSSMADADKNLDWVDVPCARLSAILQVAGLREDRRINFFSLDVCMNK
jgi:hypothetical protein